jgi:hypothetical protein
MCGVAVLAASVQYASSASGDCPELDGDCIDAANRARVVETVAPRRLNLGKLAGGDWTLIGRPALVSVKIRNIWQVRDMLYALHQAAHKAISYEQFGLSDGKKRNTKEFIIDLVAHDEKNILSYYAGDGVGDLPTRVNDAVIRHRMRAEIDLRGVDAAPPFSLSPEELTACHAVSQRVCLQELADIACKANDAILRRSQPEPLLNRIIDVEIDYDGLFIDHELLKTIYRKTRTIRLAAQTIYAIINDKVDGGVVQKAKMTQMMADSLKGIAVAYWGVMCGCQEAPAHALMGAAYELIELSKQYIAPPLGSWFHNYGVEKRIKKVASDMIDHLSKIKNHKKYDDDYSDG